MEGVQKRRAPAMRLVGKVCKCPHSSHFSPALFSYLILGPCRVSVRRFLFSCHLFEASLQSRLDLDVGGGLHSSFLEVSSLTRFQAEVSIVCSCSSFRDFQVLSLGLQQTNAAFFLSSSLFLLDSGFVCSEDDGEPCAECPRSFSRRPSACVSFFLSV